MGRGSWRPIDCKKGVRRGGAHVTNDAHYKLCTVCSMKLGFLLSGIPVLLCSNVTRRLSDALAMTRRCLYKFPQLK